VRQIAPNAFVSYCVQNRTSLKGEGNNEKGEAVLLSTTEPRDTFFLIKAACLQWKKYIYMCGLPKLTAFKATSDPARPESKQHEVEWNVECPSCSRTNAIVWPQNSFGPLVVPISKRVATKSGSGDFYAQDTSCTSCGVPQSMAPDPLSLF
jgi:molybdopterin/thiamine biosynthesis adenylyltransferase